MLDAAEGHTLPSDAGVLLHYLVDEQEKALAILAAVEAVYFYGTLKDTPCVDRGAIAC